MEVLYTGLQLGWENNQATNSNWTNGDSAMSLEFEQNNDTYTCAAHATEMTTYLYLLKNCNERMPYACKTVREQLY